jgi:hypothetical protein
MLLIFVWMFYRNYVDLVHRFYEAVDFVETFKADMAWVYKDWSRYVRSSVPLMSVITLDPASVAKEDAQLLRAATLQSSYVIPGSHGCGRDGVAVCVTPDQLIGRVARSERLNDSMIHAALQCMSQRYPGSCALDPVVVRGRLAIVLPDAPLLAHRCVVVAVYLTNKAHWVVQIVMVELHDGEDASHRVTPKNYGPLAMPSNVKVLEELWGEFTLPLLQTWHARDCSRLTGANSVSSEPTDEASWMPTAWKPEGGGVQAVGDCATQAVKVGEQAHAIDDGGAGDGDAVMVPASGVMLLPEDGAAPSMETSKPSSPQMEKVKRQAIAVAAVHPRPPFPSHHSHSSRLRRTKTT